MIRNEPYWWQAAAVPFYTGTAYFMPAVFAWLTLQDRLNHPRRSKQAGKP